MTVKGKTNTNEKPLEREKHDVVNSLQSFQTAWLTFRTDE